MQQSALIMGISLEGWLTIIAILLGPIIALALQRNSERRRSSQLRKLTIFKELMATRAAKVSQRHVDALNAIEMEFSSGRGTDKNVADAWKLYLDHLTEVPANEEDKPANGRWLERANDLLVELLFEMSKALKFKFDKVSLRKGVYSPRAHGEFESDAFLLRKSLIDIMSGKRPIWAGVFTGDRPIQMQVMPPAAAAVPPLAAQAAPRPELPERPA